MQKGIQSLGKLGEELVSNFLENKNLTIITKRFKAKGGEVDIIAQNEMEIIFCEVKYRSQFEDFEGIVDESKLCKIALAAEKFLEKNPAFKNLKPRFDIIFLDKNFNLQHLESIWGM